MESDELSSSCASCAGARGEAERFLSRSSRASRLVEKFFSFKPIFIVKLNHCSTENRCGVFGIKLIRCAASHKKKEGETAYGIDT